MLTDNFWRQQVNPTTKFLVRVNFKTGGEAWITQQVDTKTEICISTPSCFKKCNSQEVKSVKRNLGWVAISLESDPDGWQCLLSSF